MRIYRLANARSSFSRFRLRRESREVVEAVSTGQPVPASITSVRCRIIYRESRPGRLGDFPGIDALQGIVASARAWEVLGPRMGDCFDSIPIDVAGYGVERRRTWEIPSEDELPNDAWEDQPYVFLHPSRSYVGNGAPERLEPLDLSSSPRWSPEELEHRIAEARRSYPGALATVQNALAGALPPPVFVAGAYGGIFFTDDFVRLCKTGRLVGAHIEELSNDDAPRL